jgi:porphobilinogen deaminase
MIGFPDGTNILKRELSASVDSVESLGADMAEKMIKDGALDILKDTENIAFKDTRPDRI